MASSVKPNLAIFDRRTSLVLTALVVSMSLVSGLLIWMEPAPMGLVQAPSLTALRTSPVGIEVVFETPVSLQADAWQRVVIDHSGTATGDLQTLGAGYHFVIGNGAGADDGEIEIGPRWLDQRPSAIEIRTGEVSEASDQTISVCLIGDGDRKAPSSLQIRQLVRLVTALQRKLSIPRDHVLLSSAVAETTSPGRLFPTSLLLQQLIDLDVR